jgi:hypothetical protein
MATRRLDLRTLDFTGMDPLPPAQRERAIEAFNLIDPPSEFREGCAREIAFTIETIEYGKRLEPVRLSPAAQKKSYRKSAKNLRRAADIFAKELAGANIVGKWTEAQLKDAVTAAKFMADSYERCVTAIRVPKGGSLTPISKIAAGEAALELFWSYKDREPGLTRNGIWHQLAEALYGDPINFDILQAIRDRLKSTVPISQEQVDLFLSRRVWDSD